MGDPKANSMTARDVLESHDGDGVAAGVEFYPVRWSEPGSAILSLGLGAFSAYAAMTLVGRGETLGVAFIAIAAWMGWSGVSWLRRWAQRRAAIVLSEEGILDGTALGSRQLIPWSEIESVGEGERSVTLVLRGEGVVRIPLHRRVLGWLTRKSRNEYVLPTGALETPHYAVGALIQERHESLLLNAVRSGKGRLAPGTPGEVHGAKRGEPTT